MDRLIAINFFVIVSADVLFQNCYLPGVKMNWGYSHTTIFWCLKGVCLKLPEGHPSLLCGSAPSSPPPHLPPYTLLESCSPFGPGN